ncbi:hypothetical protein J1614_003335 [Plenodomus biglobosus]|nr:hypothetical protein J1614_003335 [Plenodomus biglobosus]
MQQLANKTTATKSRLATTFTRNNMLFVPNLHVTRVTFSNQSRCFRLGEVSRSTSLRVSSALSEKPSQSSVKTWTTENMGA